VYWKYPFIVMLVVGMVTINWVHFAIAALFGGLYLLFVDSMNRAQYVESLRIYWTTKNNASRSAPLLGKGFWYQDDSPFWYGSGYFVRVRNHSFNFGVLQGKGESLVDQLGRELDHTPQEIRDWGRPSAEEEEDIVSS
jgi:hypothetical protein